MFRRIKNINDSIARCTLISSFALIAIQLTCLGVGIATGNPLFAAIVNICGVGHTINFIIQMFMSGTLDVVKSTYFLENYYSEPYHAERGTWT